MCRSAAASEEDSEIFLSPAVTYGPPGLDLSCPIAMTVAHCAEVAADNWSVRLKRQAQDNKWEVRASTADRHSSSTSSSSSSGAKGNISARR